MLPAAVAAPHSAAETAAGIDPELVDVKVTFGPQGKSGSGAGIVTSPGRTADQQPCHDEARAILVTDLGNHRRCAATVLEVRGHGDR